MTAPTSDLDGNRIDSHVRWTFGVCAQRPEVTLALRQTTADRRDHLAT